MRHRPTNPVPVERPCFAHRFVMVTLYSIHSHLWGYSFRFGKRRSRIRPHGFQTKRKAIIDAKARIDRYIKEDYPHAG